MEGTNFQSEARLESLGKLPKLFYPPWAKAAKGGRTLTVTQPSLVQQYTLAMDSYVTIGTIELILNYKIPRVAF